MGAKGLEFKILEFVVEIKKARLKQFFLYKERKLLWLQLIK